MPVARTGGLAWVVATAGQMAQQMEVRPGGQMEVRPGGQTGMLTAGRAEVRPAGRMAGGRVARRAGAQTAAQAGGLARRSGGPPMNRPTDRPGGWTGRWAPHRGRPTGT